MSINFNVGWIPIIAAGILLISLVIGYYGTFGKYRYPTLDRSSVANINEIVTRHLHINYDINFNNKELSGFVTQTFESIAPGGVKKIHLDAMDLTISKVINADTKKELKYRVEEWKWIQEMENQVLTIYLDDTLQYGETCNITIYLKTSPNGLGLNWLNKAQTKSDYPFFYTDFQTIYCRSMLPVQDTPAVKFPFSATLRISEDMTVLTSGILKKVTQLNSIKEFEFVQEIPVPSYLIAIISGNLQRRQIDSRTYVYAEPQMIEQSAKVLSDIGSFLDIIEKILIPYKWGFYSIVVMPFAYPNGGMENPLITFLSPSIIISGKEAEDVAAHEIVHSWFGNLVTCANWSHTWLNEGFTVWGERKIDELFFGKDFSEASALVGLLDLQEEIEETEDPELTRLMPYVNRVSPELVFSLVPYDKGCTLVRKIEQAMGSTIFEEFLRAYLVTYAYKSVETQDLIHFFTSFVKKRTNNATKILEKIDWEKELRKEGMPDPIPVYNNSKITEAKNLAKEYIRLNGTSPANPEKYKSFYSYCKILFMYELSHSSFSVSVLERIDSDLNITQTEDNAEINRYWLRLNVKDRLDKVKSKIEKYLSTNGRYRYVLPMFQCLAEKNLPYARELFKQYSEFYSQKLSDRVRPILKL